VSADCYYSCRTLTVSQTVLRQETSGRGWNGRGCGRKRWWSNLRYCPGICMDGLRGPWKEWYSVSTENRTRCHTNTSQKRAVVASFLGVSITEVCLQNFPCLLSRLVWQLHTSVAVLGRTIRFPPGLRLLWPLLVVYAVFYQRTRVGWGTALQAGRSRDRFPMVSLEFFIYMALGLTQTLTEMSTRNISCRVKVAGA